MGFKGASVLAMGAAVPAAGFVVPAGTGVTAASSQLRGAYAPERAQVAAPGAVTASQSSVPAALAATGLALGAAACRRSQRSRKTTRSAQPVSIEEKRFPVLTKRPPLGTFPKLPETVHPGVCTGKALRDLLAWAKENKFAIPAVNCVSSSGINACLEAARKNDAPIIVQFSSGGSQFYAGKGLDNTKYHACIAGAVSGAYHVRALAEQYGVPVILHTDHCSKALLPWLDGLIDASERYFELHGEPLFSSHMIDLSEEPLEENIEMCEKYLTRMAKVDLLLEMELGITGGEEDGVNNEDANPEDLYSKPEEIWQVYEALSKVPNGEFTVAAAFGNVHGVYSPGNVKLDPEILGKAQKFISEKLEGKAGDKPVKFVFHGGSGSDIKDIKQAIDYGVIKMNIDTDTQWSYWSGIKDFEKKNRDYLQGQIGNPEGKDKPNKKYYDPRACMREAEVSTVKRLGQCFEDLNCVGVCGMGPPDSPKNVASASSPPNDSVFGARIGGLPA